MFRLIFSTGMLLILAACNTSDKPAVIKHKPTVWPAVQPPLASIKPHVRTTHNDSVVDNYYWMIDYFKNGPDSSNVVKYLEAENAYTDTMMADTKELQDSLFAEMKRRIKEEDQSVPVFKNGYYYYRRTEEGKQYFKYCRRKAVDGSAEEILLDVDAMATGKPYYAVTGMTVSDDNNLLAFGIDELSRRQYTLRVKDLRTGQLLADEIKGTGGDPVWAADNKTIFYTQNNAKTLLSEKINRHLLATQSVADVTVYTEKDNSNYIGVERSKNGHWIFIGSQSTLNSEWHLVDATQPASALKLFAARRPKVLYDVFALNDRFLIRTNQDDATNFKLMECPVEATAVANWKDVIAHRADVLLEDVEEFKDHLVLQERKNGLVQLRVRNINGSDEHYVDFGEPAYTVFPAANVEYNSTNFRYMYTSLTTPASTYDYVMTSREKRLLKQQEVVGGYSPADYVTERIYAKAKDGTSIPISLVYKKGFTRTGDSPLLLYSYGSYGISTEPAFSSNRISLLDRGFVFAMAHIRGGQEMGREWYENGKMMMKKNTFTDFIDCANHLVKEGYAAQDHVYAQGGSAGGLLMGAVINMAPQLWRGIIANVPFVDVINTMLDPSIPLTTNEYDEWGNPADKNAYEYMKSYSPYENIAAVNYPNLLVTTGLHDSQVQYFEPAKWVAKLRATKKGNNVLLLKTDMNYGHGGASGRFDYLKDAAFYYAFLLKLEGIYN